MKEYKKSLGAFYTPQRVAQILTDWAVENSQARVLDPSYGGCAFLNAALSSLSKNGSSFPGAQIYGVDIDPDAESYLDTLYKAGARKHQFERANFFEIEPSHFSNERFHAVVGNPPYIRYHSIDDEEQKIATQRLENLGINISGRASYWSFFLLYSIHFLKKGGRLAMIVPGSFLHTDYASEIRKVLFDHFQKITLHLLRERIFEATDEESVIICGEGAHLPHETTNICYSESIDELEKVFSNLEANVKAFQETSEDGGWLRSLIPSNALDIYNHISRSSSSIRLGEWMTPRIGAVTGNNNFFILSPRDADELQIPHDLCIPIIRRNAYLKNLSVTNDGLNFLHQENKEYLLIAPPLNLNEAPDSLRQYLVQGEKTGVSQAWKCKAREPWYIVPHTSAPPAFMPCMVAAWPRLTVNLSSYTCTNNIIKLLWKKERSENDLFRIALGSMSTIFQLSAELVGRSYGGGVLKVEPSEMTRLLIPLVAPSATKCLTTKVEELLKHNKSIEATQLIDVTLVEKGLLSNEELHLIKSARDILFKRRRNHRNDYSKIINS